MAVKDIIAGALHKNPFHIPWNSNEKAQIHCRKRSQRGGVAAAVPTAVFKCYYDAAAEKKNSFQTQRVVQTPSHGNKLLKYSFEYQIGEA